VVNEWELDLEETGKGRDRGGKWSDTEGKGGKGWREGRDDPPSFSPFFSAFFLPLDLSLYPLLPLDLSLHLYRRVPNSYWRDTRGFRIDIGGFRVDIGGFWIDIGDNLPVNTTMQRIYQSMPLRRGSTTTQRIYQSMPLCRGSTSQCHYMQRIYQSMPLCRGSTSQCHYAEDHTMKGIYVGHPVNATTQQGS
jgi:hypothetical protein